MLPIIKRFYKTCYITLVNKTNAEIVDTLRAKREDQKFLSAILSGLNLKQLAIGKNIIELKRTRGTIKFYLEPTDKRNWSRIRCEITTGHILSPYILVFVAVLLLSAIAFVLSSDFGLSEKVVSIGVMTVVVSIQLIKYRMNRAALIDCSRGVVKLMRD